MTTRKDMERTVDPDGTVRYDGMVAIQESIASKLKMQREKQLIDKHGVIVAKAILAGEFGSVEECQDLMDRIEQEENQYEK